MKKHLYFLIVALVSVVVVPGCKKDGNATLPVSSSYSDADFSFTGDTIIGTQIKFQSNQPAGAKISWNFSDFGPVWQKEPVHTYANKGDFTVSLLIDDKVVKQKTIHVAVGTQRISCKNVWVKKSGYWWTVMEWTTGSCGGSYGPVTYTADNPTEVINFSPEIIDDNTIMLPADDKLEGFSNTVATHLSSTSPYKLNFTATNASLTYSIENNSVTINRSAEVNGKTYWYSYTAN